MLDLIIQQLAQQTPLSDSQVATAVAQLVDESVPAGLKADFLCALGNKGETPAEIAAFARELLKRAVAPRLDPETRAGVILDVCGTGGDRLNTFNISTTVALVCAAAGVRVAKHGNRAVTSQAGSADVLEALGVRIELTPDEAVRSLREHHFAFFYAPLYHPAFRQIGPVRKLCAERGRRTVFNFLGPLLNPVRPDTQLIGVPRPELCKPIALVLQSLGIRRAMVACGRVGDAWLDELSTLGDNTIAEFYQERAFAETVISPGNFPVQPAVLADLAGADRKANAEIVRRLLRNEDRGPKRDAVLLNSAAALFVAGRTKTIAEGWEFADELLASGTAKAKLDELTRF
jgi:anthranilate phosphoribosyltransferase